MIRALRSLSLCLGLLSLPLLADEAPRVVEAPPDSPPADAIVLFDGKSLDAFHHPGGRAASWILEDGVLRVPSAEEKKAAKAAGQGIGGDLYTKEAFGDIQLHLEFRTPLADQKKGGESKGNSGIKFHSAYEIQILDSYGGASKRPKGQAAAIYAQKPPYVNASRKTGEWQVYDIIFRSPYWDAKGKKVKNGTFTVIHNGVVCQDSEDVLSRTNSNQPVAPGYEKPFFLQDHSSPVSYRNIWVRKLERKPLDGTRVQSFHAHSPRKVLASDYSKKRLALLGTDGRTEWETKIRDVHDAWQLPNGNFLFQTSWTRIVETNRKGKVVWEYDAQKQNGNEGKRVEVHAFQRLPNNVTMIVESGTARIIEVDRSGKLLKSVPLTVENPNAHSDTRNARKLESGNYLVAHEADQKVREYEPSGKVVWEYDAKGRIYSAVRLPSGNTLIGGGNLHAVIEVNPEGETVWRVGENDVEGVRLAWVTQVSRLANGNTLVVNCHGGKDNPQIVELSPDKKLIWSFYDWERFGNALAAAVVLGVETVAR